MMDNEKLVDEVIGEDFYIPGTKNNKAIELYDDVDFEVKIRFNHLDDKLIEIDDELMELYVDQICCQTDIEIARELEESTVILRAELDEIEKNIDYLLHKYEVTHDFYDEVLFEILGGLDIAR